MLIYWHIQCTIVLWKPSYTEMANASGPRMESTIRKNVLRRVQYQPHRLKEQLQKTAEGVADGLLDFILAALDGHPRHRLQFDGVQPKSSICRSYSLVADQIGRFRVPHQCSWFQFLLFLGVLLHVKRLPCRMPWAAGDDGTL